MIRRFWIAIAIGLLLIPACVGQTKALCVFEKPSPELPADYGMLDAITSVIFKVEFLADAKIGKVALVTSTHIKRLDDLALRAVSKIKFVPKMVDGKPVAHFALVHYRYSWEYPGWKKADPPSEKECRSGAVRDPDSKKQ